MKRVLPVLLVLTACAAHRPSPVAVTKPVVPVDVTVPVLMQPPKDVTKDHDTWSVKLPEEWVVDLDDDTGFRAHSPKAYGRGPVTLVISIERFGEEKVLPITYAYVVSAHFPDSVSDDDPVIDLDRKLVQYQGAPASFTSLITESGSVVTLLAVEQESTNTGFTSLCLADAKFGGNFERCGNMVRSLTLKQ